MSKETTSLLAGCAPEEWLREENPDLYYMLQAVDGDEEALNWLAHKSEGLYIFTRCLTGDQEALRQIEWDHDLDLEDLFGHLDNGVNGSSLTSWLREQRPGWALLFEAMRDGGEALHRLEHRRKRLAPLASAVHRRYQAYCQKGPSDALEDEISSGAETRGIPDDAAADMGCLVGEMHLQQGEYIKAIEAFTRSIENAPSPDVYEGRARAYRALAQEDERRAQELRSRR